MIQIPELLLPVGGHEQLIAAVENGADAIYLGCKQFNARQNASNFDNYELKRTIEYAHVRGTNVYVVLNIIINDSEMREALECANTIYEAGADAVIIQDIGFASLVKKQFPDLPIHFSTQATVYNLEGVRIAEELGASRVILSRELSLDEIKYIANKSRIDLEVFAHGALCQSYSGQCYISSMIGGRSGNRGKCAQPCRLPYTILSRTNSSQEEMTERGYYLSPKDLCMIEHLDKLIDTGIKCLKIEGRMKSAEYIAVVTRIYRKYLDMHIEKSDQTQVSTKDLKDLKQVYNRGGFSTGYFFSKQGRELITRERPKHCGTYLGKVVGRNASRKYVDILLEEELSIGDGVEIVNKDLPGNIVTMIMKGKNKVRKGKKGERVTVGDIKGNINKNDLVYKITDKELNKKARETFSRKNKKKIPLISHFKAVQNEPLHFSVKDHDENEVSVISDFIPESAINRPLSIKTAIEQIKKTGATPFIITESTFDIGENTLVPLSEINSIRRKALDDLIEVRKKRYPNRLPKIITRDNRNDKQNMKQIISVYLNKNIDEEILVKIKADRLYIPFISLFDDKYNRIIDKLKTQKIQVFALIPSVTRGEMDRRIMEHSKVFKELGIDGILIGNISHIKMLEDCDLPIMGDYSLNIYNSQSIEVASRLGLKGVTLSHELTLSEIEDINNSGIEMEATVYGRIPVLITEHCIIGSEISGKLENAGCRLCERGKYYLKDRTGADFPIVGESVGCRNKILSCDKIFVPECIQRLSKAGVTTFRISVSDESIEEINETIGIFRRILSGYSYEPAEHRRDYKGCYYKGV